MIVPVRRAVCDGPSQRRWATPGSCGRALSTFRVGSLPSGLERAEQDGQITASGTLIPALESLSEDMSRQGNDVSGRRRVIVGAHLDCSVSCLGEYRGDGGDTVGRLYWVVGPVIFVELSAPEEVRVLVCCTGQARGVRSNSAGE